jgi:hypothetical protein
MQRILSVRGGLASISRVWDSLDFDACSNLFCPSLGPLTVLAGNGALPAKAGVLPGLGQDNPADVCGLASLREPDLLQRSASELSPGVPQARWRVADWLQLLRKMQAAGMIAWGRTAKCPAPTGSRGEG